MRRRVRLPGLVALALVATLSVACSSDPGPSPSAFESAVALMESPLEDFVAEALSPGHDDRFDWTTDLCSGPAVLSLWVDEFADACRRHDFGYRNFGSGGALDETEERREWVDRIFAADLAAICEAQPPGPRLACGVDAEVFFTAVRLSPWGEDAFFG